MLIKRALSIPVSAAHLQCQSAVGKEFRLRPFVGTALLTVANPTWFQWLWGAWRKFYTRWDKNAVEIPELTPSRCYIWLSAALSRCSSSVPEISMLALVFWLWCCSLSCQVGWALHCTGWSTCNPSGFRNGKTQFHIHYIALGSVALSTAQLF